MRDYPLSTTPNPSEYTGGSPSNKVKTVSENGDTYKNKTYKNLRGDIVSKTKRVTKDSEGNKTVYKSKTVSDDKTGIESFRKTKLNKEIPQVSDLQDLRKGISKTNYDRTTGVATSRKQKDRDLTGGYGNTGVMAKTQNYSKDRAKEVLKSVGSAVKKVAKAVKEEVAPKKKENMKALVKKNIGTLTGTRK